MAKPRNRGVVLFACILAAAAAAWAVQRAPAEPDAPSEAATTNPTGIGTENLLATIAALGADRVELVPAPNGNEARYRVREQLASISFPSDAVGVTPSVTGQLVLESDGRLLSEASEFVVDLRSIESDSDRRDNYVRRNTLRTEEHPSATFVPTAIRGLSSPLPGAAEASFEVIGDLTINGVTRPLTWEVTARADDDGVRGTATTAFTFDTFDLATPRVRSVLSVQDNIRLEYDFHLVASPIAADAAATER